MIPLGIDPAVKKHALAYRTGKVWNYHYSDKDELEEDLMLAKTLSGVTDVFYEGPYLATFGIAKRPNPLTYRVLVELMTETRRVVESCGLIWHEVNPMTWKSACFTMGRYFPKTRDEQKKASLLRASDIVKHEVEDDNLADAICIAEWAERTQG